MSSKKAKINGISEDIDKRSSGYKRRIEALEPASSLIPGMIECALKAGISADYATASQPIHCRNWYGCDWQVKDTNQRYLVDTRKLSLKELYKVAKPVQGKKEIIRSVHGVPVKVIFIQNRNKKSEWLARRRWATWEN